jgi:hypothetical protein
MNSEKHSRNNTVSTEKQYYFPGETVLLPRGNSAVSESIFNRFHWDSDGELIFRRGFR